MRGRRESVSVPAFFVASVVVIATVSTASYRAGIGAGAERCGREDFAAACREECLASGFDDADAYIDGDVPCSCRTR